MPIVANVSLSDTFDQWRIKTNSINERGEEILLVARSSFDRANIANVLANTIGTNANVGINAAFTKANSALPNTTGVTFAGSLTITGNLTLGGTTTFLDLL